MKALTRRSFLATTGALVAVAACGSGSDSKGSGSGSTNDPHALTAGHVSIEPYVSTTPQRFAYAVYRNNGDFDSGAPMTVSMKGPGEAAFAAPVAATLHTEGLPNKRGVYVVEPVFSKPGIWNSRLQITGTTIEVPFQVTANPDVVTPGGAAPKVPSPTPTATLGVDPICTQDPPCPLHTVSLAQAMSIGKPVAVMFATPARCQTQYCGPVLTEMLGVIAPYQDRIQFLHIEIYKDLTSDLLSPPVDAWKLPGEPWLFGIDPAGSVVGRLDGAFATDEVKALLEKTAAT